MLFSSHEVNYRNKSYVYLSIYPHKHPSACAEVWTGTWPSTVPIRIPTVPGGRGLGYFWSFMSCAINNSTSMPNYSDVPYCYLGIYRNKSSSAWADVWSIPWPSKASNMAPGGRAMEAF